MKNINYLNNLRAFDVQSLDRQTEEWLSFNALASAVNLYVAQKDSKGTRIRICNLVSPV